jgi:hypothetical protein
MSTQFAGITVSSDDPATRFDFEAKVCFTSLSPFSKLLSLLWLYNIFFVHNPFITPFIIITPLPTPFLLFLLLPSN